MTLLISCFITDKSGNGGLWDRIGVTQDRGNLRKENKIDIVDLKNYKDFKKNPISPALKMMGNRFERAAHLFDYPSERKKSHIFSQEQYYFSLAEIDGMMLSNQSISLNENFDLQRKLSPAEEQAFFDLHYYLPDDLLVKVDKASMKYGLEARVPLLDHTIIEFSLNLDEKLKVKDGVSKYLLKEVLYDYVPRDMMNRPKWGFSIPLNDWLKSDLRELVEQYTSKEVIESAGFVDYIKVQHLKAQYFGGKDYLYNRVWAIVLLHNWWKESNG